jgi:hypothetical protein
MTLMISIPPETEARLARLAKASGTDLSQFVSDLVNKAAQRQTLEELLAPLRREFAESGMTEEQLLEEITAARQESRDARRKSAS